MTFAKYVVDVAKEHAQLEHAVVRLVCMWTHGENGRERTGWEAGKDNAPSSCYFYSYSNSYGFGKVVSGAHFKQIHGFLLATPQNNVGELKVQPNRVGKKFCGLICVFLKNFLRSFAEGVISELCSVLVGKDCPRSRIFAIFRCKQGLFCGASVTRNRGL